MADYTFAPAPVLVETTGEFAIGATGVLRTADGGDAVPVYDLNDSPLPSILVGPKGAHQAFKADISDGVLDFGSVLLPTVSVEALRAGFEALTLAATKVDAAGAVAAVQAANPLNLAHPPLVNGSPIGAGGGNGMTAEERALLDFVTDSGIAVVIHPGGVDPVRPATTMHVLWVTPDDNRPASNGTTAGGTYAAVDKHDFLWTGSL